MLTGGDVSIPREHVLHSLGWHAPEILKLKCCFLENKWESVFLIWKNSLINVISSKSQQREMKGAASRLNVGMGGRGCQGNCMDPGLGTLTFVFASAKYQLCDLGSNFWTSASSSVHENGGLNCSCQCADCYKTTNTFLHHNPAYTHIHIHMHTHNRNSSFTKQYLLHAVHFGIFLLSSISLLLKRYFWPAEWISQSTNGLCPEVWKNTELYNF